MVEADFERNFNIKALTQLKQDNNFVPSQKVEFSLFRMRQKYYESGDKAGKLLANRKNYHFLFYFIFIFIRSGKGELKTKSIDINNMFREFYADLYIAASQHNEVYVKTFLKDLIFLN